MYEVPTYEIMHEATPGLVHGKGLDYYSLGQPSEPAGNHHEAAINGTSPPFQPPCHYQEREVFQQQVVVHAAVQPLNQQVRT